MSENDKCRRTKSLSLLSKSVLKDRDMEGRETLIKHSLGRNIFNERTYNIDEAMTVEIKKIVEEFKKKIEELYGERLKMVILYGSYARGDATEDSDIDLLIVLEGKVVPGEEIDKMIDIITEINLKYGVLLSVYPVSEENYANVNSPILINVRREGIPA